jgi:NAD(P)-dependent dehydrogenase (short-subunit alcohol dehydrogenase family)
VRLEVTGALVAGGASGPGEATVRRLHRSGADLVIGDINADRRAALAAALGDRASFARVDVTEPNAVSDAAEQAASASGGLQVAVCCAGIG